MGGVNNKDKSVIVKQNPMFNDLRNLIDEFENNINQLEKEEFDSFEKLDTIELKTKIEKRENDINDELVNLRRNVKQITDFKELNKNEKEVNIIANRTQNLYSRKSEIIKNKIKPCN